MNKCNSESVYMVPFKWQQKIMYNNKAVMKIIQTSFQRVFIVPSIDLLIAFPEPSQTGHFSSSCCTI